MTNTNSKTAAQVAAAYAALRADRRCEYIGGGRIRVQSANVGFALAPPRTITVPQAREYIAAASKSQA